MSVPGVLLRSTLETHNKLHVNFAVKSLHHMEASSPLKESVEKYLDKDARVSFRVKKKPLEPRHVTTHQTLPTCG